MIRFSALLGTLLAVAACGGSAAPSGSASTGPSNQTVQPGAEPSVRTVDFQNFTYDLGSDGTYTVANGMFEFSYDADGNVIPAGAAQPDPDGYVEQGWFQVAAPVYGDVTGDGVEEALIQSELNSGGTGRFSAIAVYGMRDGAPVVIGGIPGGDRGDGGIYDVNVEGGLAIVKRLHSLDEDGACCPSKVQVEHWRWDGSRFVEDESARTMIDNDGPY
ncbi:MAG: hypothetical protein H6708_21395 [Kofleriaceae bacterium]|nr:hypothetical protein [Myxococcales bacterium]MCB9562968.1 hypothetical protein [Kofleriaceae bacterium]